MNENTLQRQDIKAWSQFSFDEKINHINDLNNRRRNEWDKQRKTTKKKSQKQGLMKTKKKKSVVLAMNKDAANLFASLPDSFKKGFL